MAGLEGRRPARLPGPAVQHRRALRRLPRRDGPAGVAGRRSSRGCSPRGGCCARTAACGCTATTPSRRRCACCSTTRSGARRSWRRSCGSAATRARTGARSAPRTTTCTSTRRRARRSSTTATGCRATTRRAPGATTATRAGRGRRSRSSPRAGTRRARSSTRSRCRPGGWWSRRAGSCWRVTRERYDALVAAGLVWCGAGGDNVPRRKVFLRDAQGLVPSTWWTHEEAGHNAEASAEQRRLFPGERPFSTPKPERLMARIVGIATDPGDLVLDPFLGSGDDRGGGAQARPGVDRDRGLGGDDRALRGAAAARGRGRLRPRRHLGGGRLGGRRRLRLTSRASEAAAACRAA